MWYLISVGERIEALFIRVWKPLNNIRVLQILRKNPKEKVKRRQYLLTDEYRERRIGWVLHLGLVWEHNIWVFSLQPQVLAKTVRIFEETRLVSTPQWTKCPSSLHVEEILMLYLDKKWSMWWSKHLRKSERNNIFTKGH